MTVSGRWAFVSALPNLAGLASQLAAVPYRRIHAFCVTSARSRRARGWL
jgi:hypothetical protein